MMSRWTKRDAVARQRTNRTSKDCAVPATATAPGQQRLQTPLGGKRDHHVPLFSCCFTPDLEAMTGEALVLEDRPML